MIARYWVGESCYKDEAGSSNDEQSDAASDFKPDISLTPKRMSREVSETSTSVSGSSVASNESGNFSLSPARRKRARTNPETTPQKSLKRSGEPRRQQNVVSQKKYRDKRVNIFKAVSLADGMSTCAIETNDQMERFVVRQRTCLKRIGRKGAGRFGLEVAKSLAIFDLELEGEITREI